MGLGHLLLWPLQLEAGLLQQQAHRLLLHAQWHSAAVLLLRDGLLSGAGLLLSRGHTGSRLPVGPQAGLRPPEAEM